MDTAGNQSEIVSEVYTIGVSPNIAPVSDAGENIKILIGETASLDGSDSNDHDNGPEPLSYNWKLVKFQQKVNSPMRILSMQILLKDELTNIQL